MTDYTSQGKSRTKNPVELANCKDHRSYYVALSRGFTAEGAVIVQGFSAQKITSGISGYLRQELRELEVLDEITRLRYEGNLPRSVTGLYRRRLIRSFYAWRTDHRDPPHFHRAMKWDKSQGPRVPECVAYTEWRPTFKLGTKRKNAVIETELETDNKQVAVRKGKNEHAGHTGDQIVNQIVEMVEPFGLVWDSRDYSWGYDATFTILGNLWMEDPDRWTPYFSGTGEYLRAFGSNMKGVRTGTLTFEHVRNKIRRIMHMSDPVSFPNGHNWTSIDLIASVLLPSKYYGSDKDCNMWFHDGISTGSKCLPEVNLRTVTDLLRLHYCGEKKAVAVIYAIVAGQKVLRVSLTARGGSYETSMDVRKTVGQLRQLIPFENRAFIESPRSGTGLVMPCAAMALKPKLHLLLVESVTVYSQEN
ncbi:hypothetical protein B0H19DRAFT_1084886 [Mycena capillaripes]|nr:hypothetical protein B0H19DRAFT_1084886 [Mycena capillaripes]